MSGRNKTILEVLLLCAVLVALAIAFPVKPLPPIEGGPRAIAHIELGSFEFLISNSMLISWIATALILILAFASTRRMKTIPSGLQNIMEAIIETIEGMTKDIAGERGKRFFPFVATIFLFVLFSNYLGLIPGVGPIGPIETHVVNGHEEEIIVPLFRSPSADLNNTVALALISVIMTQVFGFMALGIIGYGSKFLNFGRLIAFFKALLGLRPRKGMGGLLAWGLMDVFIGLVELFSEVVKIVTFSFRLFGNLFAGEVILIIMAYLFAQLLPLPFYALEIFVGFIQAYVFAILTLIFMSMATTPMHAAGGTAEH